MASAAASAVAGSAGVTPSTALSTATSGVAIPSACAKSIAFCTMSRLAASVGAMFSSASERMNGRAKPGTSTKKAWVRRRSPRRPGFRRGDRAHQVVRVEAALDERPHVAILGQLRRALGGGKGFVGRVDQFDAGEVKARLGGGVGDASFRPDEHRRQVTGELSGQGDLQRIAVAGIDHRRGKRREVADPINEPLEVGANGHQSQRGKAGRGCQPCADGRRLAAGSRAHDSSRRPAGVGRARTRLRGGSRRRAAPT